jgi:hypothetical protein
MSRSKSALFVLSLLFLTAVFAPTQQPAPADPTATLNSLEQTARNSVGDLAHLRIEKWKADANTRKGAQSDSDSIQRNMSSALPGLIASVRSNPQDLNANFKLYRNLNVLYDVFSRFAETAGAFGSREEFDILAKDLEGVDNARRLFADRVDSLTASAQSEITQLRSQARAAQATVAAPPPKKIVIDDSVSEKKPAKKKTKPASTTPAPGSDSTPAPK